jgi:hypothetical protein
VNIITLEYFDLGGVIHFSYLEQANFTKGFRIYAATGAVPAEVAAGGAEAVKAYVSEQIKRIIGAKKERDRIFDEKRRAPNM